MAVADSFDAMTSSRPYREAMSVEVAVEELKRCSGSQFDPDIVEIMISLIESGVLDGLLESAGQLERSDKADTVHAAIAETG